MPEQPIDDRTDAVRLATIEIKLDLLTRQVTEFFESLHSDSGLKAQVRQLQEDARVARATLASLTRWLWIMGTAISVEVVRRLGGVIQ